LEESINCAIKPFVCALDQCKFIYICTYIHTSICGCQRCWLCTYVCMSVRFDLHWSRTLNLAIIYNKLPLGVNEGGM